jgi:hypothetical protein
MGEVMKNKFNTSSIKGVEESRISSPGRADLETAILSVDISNIDILEIYYISLGITRILNYLIVHNLIHNNLKKELGLH